MGAKIGKSGPQADINITPLVDVVLVLLIIFMVLAPMMSKTLAVEVPQKAELEQPEDVQNKDQIILKLFADGHIELNRTTVALEGLEEELSSRYRRRKDKVMFFEAEDDAPYGNAVTLMDIAKGSGVGIIGIMTKGAEEAAPAVDGEAAPPEGDAGDEEGEEEEE